MLEQASVITAERGFHSRRGVFTYESSARDFVVVLHRVVILVGPALPKDACSHTVPWQQSAQLEQRMLRPSRRRGQGLAERRHESTHGQWLRRAHTTARSRLAMYFRRFQTYWSRAGAPPQASSLVQSISRARAMPANLSLVYF